MSRCRTVDIPMLPAGLSSDQGYCYVPRPLNSTRQHGLFVNINPHVLSEAK